MNLIEKACTILKSQGYTCVICKEDVVLTTTLRGVKPLMQWLKQGVDLEGCFAADKVIGKATAFLYCLLGAKEVYANVMSKSARDVLLANGIQIQYGEIVEYIVNQKGDGMCPFEETVLEVETPEEALKRIEKKLQELKIELS